MLLASRFPAVRRPQQLHNVALALATMQKAGLSLQVGLTCFLCVYVPSSLASTDRSVLSMQQIELC